MKRSAVILASAFVFLTMTVSHAEEKKPDPNRLFYAANHSYESRDYLKAVEGYVAILESGLESGNLYYNIGNGFLKMGRLGHAILCYERSKRLIPYDSDLRANLTYARSLVESANTETRRNFVLNALDAIFGLYSLRAIIFSATVLYLILILLAGIFIARPLFARKFRVVLFLAAALFMLNMSAVASRYFDERILKHGIVVQKEVECKYEPIEKSTTYYKLREGEKVLILHTRHGWRQIKRPDGKISWVKKEAVEEI